MHQSRNCVIRDHRAALNSLDLCARGGQPEIDHSSIRADCKSFTNHAGGDLPRVLESNCRLFAYALRKSSPVMSLKAKNLEFDKSQPAFLRRLRGEIVGQSDGDPDRHHNTTTRPRRPARLDAGEDDGPTYVMEDTNATLTQDEYEGMLKRVEGVQNTGDNDAKADGESGEVVKGSEGTEVNGKAKQKLGAIGGAKKRKAIKVIGVDDDHVRSDTKATGAKPDNKDEQTLKKLENKPKRKKAKVKIDFGDDDAT